MTDKEYEEAAREYVNSFHSSSPEEKRELFQSFVVNEFLHIRDVAARTVDLVATDGFINDSELQSSDLAPAIGMLNAIAKVLAVGMTQQMEHEDHVNHPDATYGADICRNTKAACDDLMEISEDLTALFSNYSAVLNMRKLEHHVLNADGDTKEYDVKMADINSLEKAFASSQGTININKD